MRVKLKTMQKLLDDGFKFSDQGSLYLIAENGKKKLVNPIEFGKLGTTIIKGEVHSWPEFLVDEEVEDKEVKLKESGYYEAVKTAKEKRDESGSLGFTDFIEDVRKEIFK